MRPLVEAEQSDPYPLSALPVVIRDAVREVAGYVQAPVALIAASALAADPVFDDYDRLVSHFVEFDGDAQRTWIRFHDEVEEQLGGEEAYSGIKDVASKAADNAARLACCFHVFAGDHARPIDRWSMEGACSLMRWYLNEAVRFGRAADAAPEVADAQVLEAWLVREAKRRVRAGEPLVVSVNEIRKKGPNCLRQAHTRKLDDALDLLASHDRAAVVKRVGKKGADVVLHPGVLTEYRSISRRLGAAKQADDEQGEELVAAFG